MIKKNNALWLLAVLMVLNVLAWLVVYDLTRQELEVVFFDVGQGDAIFIETPQKHQVLIDGGPDSAVLEKLGKVMPFWDRTIDLVILTHPEKDHISGLIDVLKRYEVENILWTGIIRKTSEYSEWQRLMQEEQANVFVAKAGVKVISGKVLIEVLYPFENLAGKDFERSNDTSIVSRLTFGKNSFLFTGDISKTVEQKLAASENNISSNVLKVSHHGSKTSTAPEFVAAVLPDLAVISVGRKNHYGHPHEEVLETLADYDITVLRTDEVGDIKITSDGEGLIVKF